MNLNKNPNRLTTEVFMFTHEQEEPITGKDLKSFNLQDDWIVYMDEDYDRPKSYLLRAYINRQETDEEYEARMEEIERIRKVSFDLHKKLRYEHYLELKEEFESDKLESKDK